MRPKGTIHMETEKRMGNATKIYKTPEGWRREADTTRHHREKRWNYKTSGIYHFTLVVAERFPLFGHIEGERPEKATMKINDFGHEVWKLVYGLPEFYAPKGYNLKIIAAQIMPDHIHIVLHVKDEIPQSIGMVIRGLKAACTKVYKSEYMSGDKNIAEGRNTGSSLKNEREGHNTGSSLKNEREGRNTGSSLENEREGRNTGNSLENEREGHNTERDIEPFARIFTSTGSIWEKDIARYHERILHKGASLQVLIDYVKDNPRRYAIKKANPDLFKIKRRTEIKGGMYTTLGNIFLAENPMKSVLQCSRTMTEEEIEAKREECLMEAANGTVYVSAAISPGEKKICRALREAGYRLIILLENGFPKPEDPHYAYYKPSGVYFEACAKEQLLLVEPEETLFERADIEAKVYIKTGVIPHAAKRYRFLALNALAEEIAE